MRSLVFALWSVCAALASARSGPPQDPSLKCHGKNRAECCPKIFVPTDKFQVVHDDQDIPPGLHVRLNLETGLKEAKLYDPNDSTTSNAVEVVDSGPPDDKAPASEKPYEPNFLAGGAQKVLGASGPEPIRPPPPGAPDTSSFAANVAMLKSYKPYKPSASSAPGPTLAALAGLEDTAHDIYWGLKLCEDADAVRTLTAFIRHEERNDDVRGAAALLLGTAVQNNPAALEALLGHQAVRSTSSKEALIPTILRGLGSRDSSSQLQARLVYLLSELCQDTAELSAFVNAGGVRTVLTAYEGADAPERESGEYRLWQRTADFFLDHFFQPDAAANLDILGKASPRGLVAELRELCRTLPRGFATMRSVHPCTDGCAEADEHVHEAFRALEVAFKKVDSDAAVGCASLWQQTDQKN